MVDAFTRFTIPKHKLFASEPTKGIIESAKFGFASPAGDEDANINRVLVGDLVYVIGGVVKKLKRGTAIAATSIPGLVVGITDIDKNRYDNVGDQTFADPNGRLFTEEDLGLEVYIGNWWDYPIYADQVYIHAENGASADTRELLDIGVDAASGGALEGRIKLVKNASGEEQFIFN